MIVFKCPHCSFVKENVASRLAGRKVKCPNCKMATRLPRKSDGRKRFKGRVPESEPTDLLNDIETLKNVSKGSAVSPGFKGYSTNPKMVKQRNQFAATTLSSAEQSLARQRHEAEESERIQKNEAIINRVLVATLSLVATGVLITATAGIIYALSRFKQDADQFIEEVAQKNRSDETEQSTPSKTPVASVQQNPEPSSTRNVLDFPEIPKTVTERVVLGFPDFPEQGWSATEADIRSLLKGLNIDKGADGNRFFLKAKVLRYQEYVEVSYVFEADALIRVRMFRNFGRRAEVFDKIKQTELLADAISSKLGEGQEDLVENRSKTARTWSWEAKDFDLRLHYSLVGGQDDYYFATLDVERPETVVAIAQE